ncbi:MAG: hypothetical protein ACPLRX_00950 [Candidatus Saccharicenans sp.]
MKNKKIFFSLAFLLTLITLTNIIAHDFFCHEELHRLFSPVHHSFQHSSYNPVDFIIANLKEISIFGQDKSAEYLANFFPSIFHPPD